jgi:hypothetical protein
MATSLGMIVLENKLRKTRNLHFGFSGIALSKDYS